MKIYYCNINEFNDLAGMEYLSPERRERVERYQTMPAKTAGLAAGLLLRMTLGDDYENRMTTNAHGKPQLKDNPLFFNLSHSGDYVVLAVSDCELGIDIEKIAPYNPKVAERCFTANEKEWLKQQENNAFSITTDRKLINDHGEKSISCFQDIHHPFYYLWTGKEAVMKATGLGFSMNPESFSLLPIQNGAHQIHEQVWHLNWDTFEHHQVCVASAHAVQIQWEFLSREKILGFFTAVVKKVNDAKLNGTEII